MKKLIAMLLVLVMVFAMAACGAQPETTEPDQKENTGDSLPKFKIGVAELTVTDETMYRQKYYSEYIGPKYNCEFIFSEALPDANAAMTFIENCASAGCDAIISGYNLDTEQLLQKCQDLDMVFVQNIARVPRSEAMFTGGYDNFGGTFAEDQVALGQMFKEYMLKNLDANGEHGYIVCTSIAYNGHLQATMLATAMLESIAEVHGMTFTEDISTYLASTSPMMAENDKGIPVYIYPDLYTADGWVQGLTAELQTGAYDYLLGAVNIYVALGVALDEVERAYNKDIKLMCLGIPGDALTAAFETKDMFGNSTIDMSCTKFSSVQSALAFIEVYNMLTGYGDCLNDENGEKSCLGNRFVLVDSAEKLAVMNSIDREPETYIANYDFVDSLLGINDPTLTGAKIKQVLADTLAAKLTELGVA